MTQINLLLDPGVAQFYSQIAKVTGYPLEQVINDALFKLAGELSLEALENAQNDFLETNCPIL